MKIVEPIREVEKIWEFEDKMKELGEREHILFLFCIYSGLRISDVLNLKVDDVKEKHQITIKEQKTGKEKRFSINPILKKEIRNYIQNKSNDDYLFSSRQKRSKKTKSNTTRKDNTLVDYRKKSDSILTRQRVWQILKKVSKEIGIDHVGCHTFRKTFGYHRYKQTKDVVELMKLFNHSEPGITLRYIGYTQDNLNKAINSMDFRRKY